MKKYYYILNPKSKSFFDHSKFILFLMMVVLLFFPNYSKGQVTLFQFNFENNTTPTIDNVTGVPAFTTNGLGTVAYTGTNPCQGSRMLTADNWDTGDYYRFTVNTTGFANMTFSFCNRTDATTIGTFIVRVSANGGGSWTTVLTTYTPTTSNNTLVTSTFPTVANNDAAVWIEIYKTNNANSNNRDYIIDAATLIGYRIPTITSFDPTSGCIGEAIEITGTNFTGATDVSINGTPATFTVDSATQITATIPTGASSGDITVTTSGGTATSPSSLTVNIPSIAPASISGTSTICNGNSTTLTLVGGTAGTGATAEWFSGSCAGGTAAGTGNSITVSPATTTDYFVRYNGTCNTTTCASVTVTVNPLPANPANPTSNSPQCSPTDVTITQTGSAPVGETWYWQTIPLGISTANSNSTYTATTTGTYYLRSQDNVTGCWSANSGSAAVVINPLPLITYTTDLCVGTDHQFSPDTNGTWISNNPSIATITASGYMVGITAGIVTFTFTDSNTGCSITTGNVNVYDLPIVSAPIEVCVGETITLSPSSAGTWVSNDTAIATVDLFTGVVTGIAAGSTTFTYTEFSPGCSATTNAVNVKALPVLGGPNSVCIGDTIQLTPNSGGTWISNDTTVATIDNSTGLVTGVNSGNTTFTFTDATTGCSQTTNAINVYSYSIAPTNILGVTTICEGTSTTLTVDGGFIGSGGTVEWFSDSCGGTSAGTGNSIVVSPIVNTTYFVRYSGICNTTSCASVLITVDPLPLAAGSITGNSTVCQGQNSVVYTVPAITYATGYNWTLPSGATIASGANTNSITVNFATNAISGNITVQGTNCGVGIVSADFPVTVNPLPDATGMITGNTTVCQGENTVIYTVPPITNATGYIWTLPTGASIVSGSNTNSITVNFATNAISGDITVQGTNACGNGVISANYTITVNPLPIAAGTISGSSTVCQGQNTVIYSVPSITFATGYNWTLPAGASIAAGANTNSITVNFATNAISGFFRVYGTNACGNGIISAVYPVIVNPLPDNAGIISGPNIVCQGQNSVVYTVPLIANATGYNWTLPTGASIVLGANTNTITVDYALNATSGNITVQGTNACGNGIISLNYPVTVNITPSISTNYSPTVCSEELVTVSPIDGGGNIVPPGTTYSWNLPSVTGGITGATALSGQTTFNQTLTNPTNTTQTASYNVTATTGGCSASTFSILVSVYPKPTIDGFPTTQTICSGDDINSILFSNPNIVAGTIDYNWTRDNTTNVTGGIGISGSGDISGKLYNTTNTPQITVFTVIAMSEDGCESTPFNVNVIVNPNPSVSALPASQSVCSEVPITDIVMSSNGVVGTTYSWTRTNNTPNLTGIPDGSGSTISGTLTNTTNIPQTTVFTITAAANGCDLNTTTVSITVNPKPTVAVSSIAQNLCGSTALSPITISNPNLVAGTTYSWTRDNTTNLTGIASSGSGSTISGTFTNTTNSDQVSVFTVTAKAGTCNSNTTISTITVKPTPTISITPLSQTRCNATIITPINITNPNNVAGTTYTWTRNKTTELTGIANSGIENTASFSITGTLTNTTTINQTVTFTIIATAANGCSKTATATVTVYPPLVASVISASQTVCILSTPAQLTSTLPTGGSGAYTYQWQSSSTSTGPWANIAGATSLNYQPPFVGLGSNDIYYRLRITSCGTTLYSNIIFVEVVSNVGFSFNVNNGFTGTLCPGTSFTPTINSVHLSTSAVRYDWSADSNYILPSTGGPVGTTGNITLFIFRTSSASIGPLTTQNNTNATVTTQVSMTPSVYNFPGPPSGSFICSVTPQLFDVTIYPKPIVYATVPNLTICNGTSAGIVLSGNITDIGNTTTFNWSVSDNPNITGDNTSGSGSISVGGTYPINNVLTNTSTTTQDVTYTITPISNGCSGTSITVTITVAPPVTPGTVVANQTICSGDDPEAFTETVAATGIGTLDYQWQSTTNIITPSWSDINLATGVNYDAPAGLLVTTWYRRVVTSTYNGAVCSNATGTPIQVTINSINPGTIGGTQTVCSPSGALTLTSTAAATGSGSITYQWESSTTDCNSGFSDITLNGNSETYNVPSGLLVTTYFRRKAISSLNGVDCFNYSNCLTITINNVTPGSIGSDQTICTNNPNPFTSIAIGAGSGALAYQWQKSTTDCNSGFSDISGAIGITYDAPAGLTVTTYYRRRVTSTLNSVACVAYSNCVTVTANGVTAGTIIANRTVCYGGDPAPFTVGTAATGTNINYQWQNSTTSSAGPWTDIAGATASTYDEPGPVYQETYYRRVVTASANGVDCIAYSNFVVVYVNEVTASVVSGDQTLCSNLNPAAFSIATPAIGTGTLSYQWQSSTTDCTTGFSNIFGANSDTYDPPAITQTTYYRVICTSTLNGIPCNEISNCITVISLAKSWTGLLNNDWNNAGNWSPNGVPNATNCVIIPNAINDPIISSTSALAYNLTVLNGGKLEISPLNAITVTDVVNVNANGQFILKNSSSLIQINNVTNIVNGTFSIERITAPMYRYDYTYWGSPVSFSSNYTLGTLSPNTRSDKYYSWIPSVSNGNGNWKTESVATVMNPIKGYIVRAPDNYSTNPATKATYTATFNGIPNNGTLTAPVSCGMLGSGTQNDKWNLLGNPYPSALNAIDFLNFNTNIKGYITLWTHNTAISASNPNPFYGTFQYNYSPSDELVFNAVGPNPPGFDGNIATGQGFMVSMLDNCVGVNSNVTFNNTMRNSSYNNAQFYKSINTDKNGRIWLSLVDANKIATTTLIGYMEGATYEKDRLFDATTTIGEAMKIYSLIENSPMNIQGRPLPFDANDTVSLGIKIQKSGVYNIGIDQLDKNFENQEIYLEDKSLNIIHNLKQSIYSFASEMGTFNDRFILRYNNASLDTQVPTKTVGLIALVNNQKIIVQSSEKIEKIQIFDISGKLIKTYLPSSYSNQFEDQFIFAEGIYIAKIQLENNLIETRKLVNEK